MRPTLLAVWRDGLSRVFRAPAVWLLLWTLTLATTALPAWFMQGAITTHLDSSLAAERAADGMNFDWLQEFQRTGALQRSLRVDVIGGATVMDNTSALLDMRPRPQVLVVTGAVFVLLLWILTPGCIHRVAKNTPIGAAQFASTCGRLLLPMLRLNLGAAVVYGALFGSVHAWLFDDVFEQVTRELTVERTAFVIRLACYVAFLLLVGLVNLVADMARVRMVVEGRRSAVASAVAALSFIGRNVRLTAGAYLLNVLLLGGVLTMYAVTAPGVGTAGWDMWAAFAFGQVYLLARLGVKLLFWGSEAAALQQVYGARGFVRA